EAPPRRSSREAPDLPRPTEQRPQTPRDVPRPPGPAAPTASHAAYVEPKNQPAPAARTPQQESRPKVDAPRVDVPTKNGAAKGEQPRGDAPKADLAPTWRKFLDRLTSTFDTRTGAGVEAPRENAAPAEPTPMTLQPFAADIEVNVNEVAPDEVIDESP